MRTPWLANLSATGVTPEEKDYVMCTHLHIDHLGWNTRLNNGQWAPTFPNAKYLFAKSEFDFWQRQRHQADPDTFSAVNNQTFDDSVLPILDLAEMIDGEFELIADLIHLQPAPGHTPGSMTLALASNHEQALFTGDICHHPIQVTMPTCNSAYCELPDEAIETRQKVLAACAADHILMLPAHFGPGPAGYVIGTADGFHFSFESGD